jgi:DNA-binding transcriptional regulator YiaG
MAIELPAPSQITHTNADMVDHDPPSRHDQHCIRAAQRLAAERRDLMRALMDQGVSQAHIARELGVSRQAVQKMLAC